MVLLTFFGPSTRATRTRTSRPHDDRPARHPRGPPRSVSGSWARRAGASSASGSTSAIHEPSSCHGSPWSRRSAPWRAARLGALRGTQGAGPGPAVGPLYNCSSTLLPGRLLDGRDRLPRARHLSAAVYWFNQKVLDGVVNGAAWPSRSSRSDVVRPPRDRRRRQRRPTDRRVGRHPEVPADRKRAALRRRAVRRRARAAIVFITSRVRRSVKPDDLGELGHHDHHVAATRRRAGDRPDAVGEGPASGPRHRVHRAALVLAWRSRSGSTTAATGLQFEST